MSGEVEETAFGWTAFRIIGDEKHLYIFNILLKGDNFNHGETGGCVGCNAHVIKQAEASLIGTQHVSTAAAIDFLVGQIVNQDIVSGAGEQCVIARPTIEHVSIIVTGQVIRSISAVQIIDGILGRTCSNTWRNSGVKHTVVCAFVSVDRWGLGLIVVVPLSG